MKEAEASAEQVKTDKLLGAHLRKLREQQGVSLATLSAKLKISVVQIVAIEDGNWHAFDESRARYVQFSESLSKEMGLDLLDFVNPATKVTSLTAKAWNLPSQDI